MEIKQIRLSPKRGGNGFISSYSVNIGTREARECLLSDSESMPPVIKILDPENRQIILRLKQYTLTPGILDEVCAHASLSKSLSDRLLENPVRLDPQTGVYQAEDQSLLQQARTHDEVYYSYLLSLPAETLTDLMTLMCMGRDQDVDLSLPQLQRFLTYWQQLEQYGSFSLGSDALASQLMYNQRLADYLRNGLALMEIKQKP